MPTIIDALVEGTECEVSPLDEQTNSYHISCGQHIAFELAVQDAGEWYALLREAHIRHHREGHSSKHGYWTMVATIHDGKPGKVVCDCLDNSGGES